MNDLLSVVQCFQTTNQWPGRVLPRSGLVQVAVTST
jgi:hypothetical protein